MNVDENDNIYEFEEKPEHPKSNLASMGVYIFSWEKLRKYLIVDEHDPKSENDFGKNIIPNMLANREKMSVYRFSGYWKDVGTIDSLWDANMDMLPPSNLNPFDSSWPIYARSVTKPPHSIGRYAKVQHSIVTEGCDIEGAVENSVLFNSVTVEAGAIVRYSILLPGVRIARGAVVEYAIIADNTVIGKDAHVGGAPCDYPVGEWGVATVGSDLEIGDDSIIPPQAMIWDNVSLRNREEMQNV